MKTIKQIILSLSFLFALSMFIYSFQINVARGDFELSKRQDFATDDTTFHTNEDIYIKVGIDQARKLHQGKARVRVMVRQDSKTRFGRSVPLVIQGDKTEVSYRDDIQPLYTQDSAWFDNPILASTRCGNCHFASEAPSFHEMNLTTREGMLNGADEGTVPILGESTVGATDYNWEKSVLRGRERNNRMPPGWPFDPLNPNPALSNNRNGPNIVLDASADGDDFNIPGDFSIKKAAGNYEYGSSTNAVGLIETWVMGTGAGINDGNGTTYDGDTNVTWDDVAPFFIQRDTWFSGSLACTVCHYSDQPPSFHAIDLSSPDGIRGGSDGGTMPILGENTVGIPPFNWSNSDLRKRLRNNRMPPTSPFVLDESNRNGRTLTHPVTGDPVSAVDLIGEWVAAGCPDN